ncbi:hypothetical protein SAMN05216551_10759 [Chitinasiproducens palmae]|uniref:Uncharacterized protein n=1 Tax=Chitinasiproducens palmae TaxID=1770053 RepID=A0A1H2PQL2_9BURK|nr:hypothetical protein SAMN05216551_10759 [Chitinasiproducens palmae]
MVGLFIRDRVWTAARSIDLKQSQTYMTADESTRASSIEPSADWIGAISSWLDAGKTRPAYWLVL